MASSDHDVTHFVSQCVQFHLQGRFESSVCQPFCRSIDPNLSLFWSRYTIERKLGS